MLHEAEKQRVHMSKASSLIYLKLLIEFIKGEYGDKIRRIGWGQAMDDFECQDKNFGIYFLESERNLKDLGQIKDIIGSVLSED